MKVSSNELDLLWLQDGTNGIPGKDGYVWVKYSREEYLADILDENNPNAMTDDPENAVWIGISNEMSSQQEENDPNAYNWSKIRGDQGYTIILSNENISIIVDSVQRSMANQVYQCEITIYQGITLVDSWEIDTTHMYAPEGISLTIDDNNVVNITVIENAHLPNPYGSIVIPVVITNDTDVELTFQKIITYTTIQSAEDLLSYTWIKYADSATPSDEEDMSDSSIGMSYLGIAYDKFSADASADPADYEWIEMNTVGSYVISVQKLYYKSLYNELEEIPSPAAQRESLGVNQGLINVTEGNLEFGLASWGEKKYSYSFGYYLWVALEIKMSDGSYLYTTPLLSDEWGNDSEIGGVQLVRNSKTLVDDRIEWF